jgi:hypothetical protein
MQLHTGRKGSGFHDINSVIVESDRTFVTVEFLATATRIIMTHAEAAALARGILRETEKED